MEKEKLNPKSSDDEIENHNTIMPEPDDLFNTRKIVEGNHKKQEKVTYRGHYYRHTKEKGYDKTGIIYLYGIKKKRNMYSVMYGIKHDIALSNQVNSIHACICLKV